MKNDTISDFLIRIKNAYLARHKTVETQYAKILEKLARILVQEKFIEGVRVKTENGNKKLFVNLAYRNRRPALEGIARVSKPGLRMYTRRSKIPKVYGGFGIVILSTPKGLMTGRDAMKQNVGGEMICKVW